MVSRFFPIAWCENKKAAHQALASVPSGERDILIGSFACGARHWTPMSRSARLLHRRNRASFCAVREMQENKGFSP
jgi:hypothetical protein